jgi:hypothetical protein
MKSKKIRCVMFRPSPIPRSVFILREDRKAKFAEAGSRLPRAWGDD